jgi:DNA-binding NtrC family response regulator
VPRDLVTAQARRVAIGTSMAEIERIVILETLRHYNHHKERVAAVLGISLKTLYNRLKEYAAESGDARYEQARLLLEQHGRFRLELL